MAVTINHQFLAAVDGGPAISGSGKITPDSYELTKVSLDIGVTNKRVDLSIDDKVDMLVLSSDDYSSLTYKKTAGGTAVPITAPLILIGSGAVGLLSLPVASLLLSNGGTKPCNITVLISRDVTP